MFWLWPCLLRPTVAAVGCFGCTCLGTGRLLTLAAFHTRCIPTLRIFLVVLESSNFFILGLVQARMHRFLITFVENSRLFFSNCFLAGGNECKRGVEIESKRRIENSAWHACGELISSSRLLAVSLPYLDISTCTALRISALFAAFLPSE